MRSPLFIAEVHGPTERPPGQVTRALSAIIVAVLIVFAGVVFGAQSASNGKVTEMSEEYRWAHDAVFREVETGGVLLNKRTGEYRQVNRTGSRVLRMVQGGARMSTILDRMGDAYPAIEPEQLSRDIREMLNALTETEVIVHD